MLDSQKIGQVTIPNGSSLQFNNSSSSQIDVAFSGIMSDLRMHNHDFLTIQVDIRAVIFTSAKG
jgi:hypothetical protein